MLMWQPMQENDLQNVVDIANEIHVGYPESPLIYAERFLLFPQGCWVVKDQAKPDAPLGYAVMHPGIIGSPPGLDSLLQDLPDNADCLYLHDVALLPAARQSGLGGSLVDVARRVARTMALQRMALIAVHNSAPYWQRQGFAMYADMPDSLCAKLKSYSDDAQYLVLKMA